MKKKKYGKNINQNQWNLLKNIIKQPNIYTYLYKPFKQYLYKQTKIK